MGPSLRRLSFARRARRATTARRPSRTGIALCREAPRHGTRILFATPHVWPELPLTAEREEEIRAAYERIRPRRGLELRLGFELTPAPRLLDEDPRRYVLEGTDAC